jgi:hypothetical protein
MGGSRKTCTSCFVTVDASNCACPRCGGELGPQSLLPISERHQVAPVLSDPLDETVTALLRAEERQTRRQALFTRSEVDAIGEGRTAIPTSDEPSLDEDGYPLNPYDEVAPGLFQASTELTPEELFEVGFDAVFDLCGFNRGAGLEGPQYVFHLIDDVPYLNDAQAIDELSMRVAELVRSERMVAVNCMSGFNRSGLLVGRTLIELGQSPLEAVELVRAARGPRALSNRVFTGWLLTCCTPRKIAERRASENRR